MWDTDKVIQEMMTSSYYWAYLVFQRTAESHVKMFFLTQQQALWSAPPSYKIKMRSCVLINVKQNTFGYICLLDNLLFSQSLTAVKIKAFKS